MSCHASKEVGTEPSLEYSRMNTHKGCSQSTAIRNLSTQDRVSLHSGQHRTGHEWLCGHQSTGTLVQVLQLSLEPLISHLCTLGSFCRKWGKQLTFLMRLFLESSKPTFMKL